MTMQPYRHALAPATCLDPPRLPTCDERPSRPRLWVMALAVTSILGGASCAFAATHREGHIEIGPAALTRATHEVRPKPAPSPPPRSVGVHHPWLGGVHETGALVARARELQRLGVDITLVDATLTETVAGPPDLGLRPGGWRPVFTTGRGSMGALELERIPRDSWLGVAGVESGDQILGIDGYHFDDGSYSKLDVAAIQRRGRVVLELARGDRHVVLAIRWPVSSGA